MDIELFKIVDEIINISSDEGVIVTASTIPFNAKIFDYHFPDLPILPGVFLIELMAQSAGHLIMASTGFSKMAVLVKISSCKFNSFIHPGERVICTVQSYKKDQGFVLIRSAVESDGKMVCSAEICMKIVDFPSENARLTLVDSFENMFLQKDFTGIKVCL